MTKEAFHSGMNHQVQEPKGPLPHGDGESRRRATPATDSPHDGWDTPSQDHADTFAGLAQAQDEAAVTPQGQARACPVDLTFRDRVQEVRYALLVETLMSAHCEALSQSRAGQRSDSAREAAAQSAFDERFASLVPTEQHLLMAALEQMSGPGAAIWSKRLTWHERKWRLAAEHLLDTITRGWLYTALCDEHGPTILPYLDQVLEALSVARFCRPKG